MTDFKTSELPATTTTKDTDLVQLSVFNGVAYDSRKMAMSNFKGFVSGYVNVVTKTASYVATTADTVILCDATSGDITITLPTAVGISGKVFNIKKTNSNANSVTIDANASQTIDGDLTQIITSQYDSVTIVSDGSNWHII